MSGNSFVKILIKAPNQLVDDQTVHCERNWTIKRLKHHLSNVYPCKPHPDGQKLIYSGQLLCDEAVLSDVLRSYDGQENNTIHLVCSLRDTQKMSFQAHKAAPQQDITSSRRETNSTWRGDELRSRNTSARPSDPVVFPPIDNNFQTNYAQQNMLFQQAYLNYMAHFSQAYMMANRMGPLNNGHLQLNNQINVNNQENINANGEIGPNDRNEDDLDEAREEARGNRDWLEWFYIVSRLFILFTLVYFYSSPERFILVIAMALILINIDVFRWRRGHNLVEPQPGETNIELQPTPENAVHQQNFIHITWTFMKTFFLSLVPDNREI